MKRSNAFLEKRRITKAKRPISTVANQMILLLQLLFPPSPAPSYLFNALYIVRTLRSQRIKRRNKRRASAHNNECTYKMYSSFHYRLRVVFCYLSLRVRNFILDAQFCLMHLQITLKTHRHR